MDVRFIHTGDLHLGLEFKNASFDNITAKERRREIWYTFEKIVDRCKNENIDLLLIAGDLFEEEYCTVGDIKRISSKLKEIENVKVVIAAGNHDYIGDKTLYSLVDWPENVFLFYNDSIEKIEFEDINTVVWGLSWNKAIEKRNIVSEINIEDKDKTNILLVHGDIFNQESVYLPIDKKNVEGFDYVALGHIHKPQFITGNIAYCGSPEPLDFGETGSHGIIEGTISEKDIKVDFIPFSIREFIAKDILIDESTTYQDIMNKIVECDTEEKKQANLYRIILSGLIDSDIKISKEDMEDSLRSDFYYIEIIDNTTPDYDLEALEKDNKDNIIGAFISTMREKGLNDSIVKDALYEGLEVLLSEKVKK